VLLVSEDLDEILQLSDRIVVMSDGKLALQTEGRPGRCLARSAGPWRDTDDDHRCPAVRLHVRAGAHRA